jgi:hypothetical protein
VQTQKSCNDKECRRKRKEAAQRRWVKANPGCFTGRYEQTRQWREENQHYQCRWRLKRKRGARDTRRDTHNSFNKNNGLQMVECEIQDKIDIQPFRVYSDSVNSRRTIHGNTGDTTNDRNIMGGSSPGPSTTARPQSREVAAGIDSNRGDKGAAPCGKAASPTLPLT